MNVIIYTLKDPLTNEVKYIGKTTQSLRRRLQVHIYESNKSTNTHKKAWIKGLTNKNIRPIIEEFDVVSESDWKFWEKYWISQFKTWEFNLTNSTKSRFKSGHKPINSKSVKKYDLDGNFLTEYDSFSDAAESIGVTYNAIRLCIQRKTFKCKGFLWKN